MASILAVQSFKGGTGKSTITANLAVTLAKLGKRVAVIDLDLEGPGLPKDPLTKRFTDLAEKMLEAIGPAKSERQNFSGDEAAPQTVA